MPRAIAGRDATILVNQIDASEYLNEYEIEREADDIEVTRFGALDKEYLSGPHENTVTLTGHYSGDQNALDDILDQTFGVPGDQTCTICPKGAIEGEQCYLVPLVQTSEALSAQADDITEDEWEFRASAVRRAVVLIGSDQLISGTTAVTSVDPYIVAALTTKGASAHLHVLTQTGATAIAAKVEHSVDGTTWAPLISFDSMAAAGHQRKATLANVTVNVQLRGSVTLTGTTPSATVVMCVARHKR